MNDDSLTDLLGSALKVADTARPMEFEVDLEDFLPRFYEDVAPEDLIGKDPIDLVGPATHMLRLGATRPQGTAVVDVFTPTVAGNEWTCGHTVVQVVTDDMPFLLDSVVAAITEQGKSLHLVAHPIYAVERDVAGALRSVLAVSPDEAPDTATRESWIHLEIDLDTDPAQNAALEEVLYSVLRDVREAVEDWQRMTTQALSLAEELRDNPPQTVPAKYSEEAAEFLQWLGEGNFTFLGYRTYDLIRDPDPVALASKPGTGLGLLRSDRTQSQSFSEMPPAVRAHATEPRVLVLTKANSRSTVHRPVRLDYVGVKRFDAEGTVIGEHRFIGLFTSSTYNQSVTQIPVLRRRVEELFELTGFPPNSHSGKDLLQFCETYPRDDFFQTDSEELFPIARAVLQIHQRRQTRLFTRHDRYGRYVSALVYLPRDRYNTNVRERVQSALLRAYGGASVDHAALLTESVLARLHMVVHMPARTPIPEVDEEALERELAEVVRSWDDHLSDALIVGVGEERAGELARVYEGSFPEAYKEDVPAREAVSDIQRLEALGAEGVSVSLAQPAVAESLRDRRFKIYRAGPSISLVEVIPILTGFGVEVLDERPYKVTGRDGVERHIYDFGLRLPEEEMPDEDTFTWRFSDAFLACWSVHSDADRLNTLVTTGGLDWREVAAVRAWVEYARQIGSPFSAQYMTEVLVSHTDIVNLLVGLFEARHDPAKHDDRHAKSIHQEILTALDSVASLDDDRVIRQLLGIVMAVLRTNYYQRIDGAPKPWLSFKIDPREVPGMPLPHPRFEIFVTSPRMSGVHLRFGRVARGGLRWSDRREDFRTEVLGLVKAQMVKNAVIVPVGSKGGFVVKNPPPAANREAFMAEGIDCYKTFISGLLDLTDNLRQGQVVPPPDVHRRDGDDTYLVVAADKGTASFSDIANSVAQDYGFWLGDAFASGGSVGYDHKAMGITARGAWESVKRHFLELGVDTQSEDFTVVGIGDMSGDVFGNGMLLSEHIGLVAAFDHRDIFLDPAPDVAAAFRERKRLFELSRSSWQDYNSELISAGGGVFSRSLKSVPISKQVRKVLGLADGVKSMTPNDLLHAILQAPVDLLWNGGIGTYVRAETESDAQVGDKANDAIRVTGSQLRCKVVGEGGNLGMTQLGRIEAAEHGVRLNTDAIDNSAGVDTSDHEVNIKILLDRIVHDGDLTVKQRNELLAAMTDDVADLVLANNYWQNMLLSNGRSQQGALLPVHQRVMALLEQRGLLDRRIEFLPDDEQITERIKQGRGLSSPELSVLLAWSKIALTDDLMATNVDQDDWAQETLAEYFPPDLRSRYENRLAEHPLRKEIVITMLANDIVNHGGITFMHRVTEETGASVEEIARAYVACRQIFDLDGSWEEIRALDRVAPTAAQNALYLEIRRLLDRSVRWVLTTRGGVLDVSKLIDGVHPVVHALTPMVPDFLRGTERQRLEERTAEFVSLGAPEPLAMRVAACLDQYSLLDIADMAAREKQDPESVAWLYFAVSERFGVDALLTQISNLDRADRWSALARGAVRQDLYAAQAGLTVRVMRRTDPALPPEERIAEFEKANPEGLTRARTTLTEIRTSGPPSLATVSVALRLLRNVSQQGS
ncbi:MAG: NAD-glutamate dehydrogenase [Candidatus Nanopelagicales bacterium]